MDTRKMVEALVIIEGLTLIAETDMAALYHTDAYRKLTKETVEKIVKYADDRFGNVYRLAHQATEHCKGCCTSENIKKQDETLLAECKKGLKDANIVDVDKEVDKIMAS